jgi:phage repressor protein C with HTH and peptisase S24 domain
VSISKRIRERRRERQLTQQQVADAFGINKASVAEWESGRTAPTRDRLVRLAEILDTNVDYLLLGDSAAYITDRISSGDAYLAVRHVRFKLAAGVGGYEIQFDNGEGAPLYFRRDWLQKRKLKADKLIALKVHGSSMEPGLYDGDTVVVNLADVDPVDGVVFALNYEGQCVVKRLKRDAGQWWISSDNSDKRFYPDKRCDEAVQIIGRVVHRQSEHI